MKAVIPCAKKEDNLFPFIESTPTGLMPVAGKPVVEHLVTALENSGIEEIYLVANYRIELFKEKFSDHRNVEIVEQEELNGTGGAVEACDFIEQDFLVVNGDVAISQNDIQNLVKKHEQKTPEASVLATDEQKPEKFGVLSIENDRVVEIQEKPEKPENTLVNTGIYIFNPGIFETLSEMDGDKHLTDALNSIIEEEIRFELVEDYWIDIGSPKKLMKADHVKLGAEAERNISEDAEVHESAEILGRVEVREGAEVKSGAVVEGPCIIAENAEIDANATIRNSTVNRNSYIRNANIEDAVIFPDVDVEPYVDIRFSVIAEESKIKSGTAISESFIGPRSFIEVNNSIKGLKFVPDARTDLSEISK
jgi:NDP-sugar pyrophosphorylase family protein